MSEQPPKPVKERDTEQLYPLPTDSDWQDEPFFHPDVLSCKKSVQRMVAEMLDKANDNEEPQP